jgi:hypothetical protein
MLCLCNALGHVRTVLERRCSTVCQREAGEKLETPTSRRINIQIHLLDGFELAGGTAKGGALAR